MPRFLARQGRLRKSKLDFFFGGPNSSQCTHLDPEFYTAKYKKRAASKAARTPSRTSKLKTNGGGRSEAANQEIKADALGGKGRDASGHTDDSREASEASWNGASLSKASRGAMTPAGRHDSGSQHHITPLACHHESRIQQFSD